MILGLVRSVAFCGGIALFAVAASSAAGSGPTSPPQPALTHLSQAQRSVFDAYLGALSRGDYAAAFALLTREERRYFGSPENFASGFVADGLKISSYKAIGLTPFSGGVVVSVSEDFQFNDPGHAIPVKAKGRVDYGLINEDGKVRVKDPSHPWLAVVPKNATVTQDGLRVTVNKVSFFTGRVEVLLTFSNIADTTVTLLPYGRSVLRDAAGTAYHPIETKLPGLTDRNLRLGLRLPSDAQYTGALTFLTPNRFTPQSLSLTIAPQLRDGADAPFEVDLPIALRS
jgi:hypothetical protein